MHSNLRAGGIEIGRVRNRFTWYNILHVNPDHGFRTDAQSGDDMEKSVIEAVIPVYKPDQRLLQILDRLSRQTVPVHTIHLINTGEEILAAALASWNLTQEELLARWPNVVLTNIRPEEFDHGGTRNAGFHCCSQADYILTMTQDALPADDVLIEELMRPLDRDPMVAVSYARQLANPGAQAEERLSRVFNYPEEPLIKSQEDTKRLGIKAYFCSDVCAMYRRDIWDTMGGFADPVIFNEDMVYAGHALQAGYRICYAAQAMVYHSHTYTAMQQFHRNFDLGVSQTMHPEVFGGLSSEGEGMQYVRAVSRQLLQEGRSWQIPAFGFRCAARLLGYRMGRRYQKLPEKVVIWCSSNRQYWKKP